MEVTRVEQRACIKIVVLRGRNAMECHSELVEALENNAPPYRTVARWEQSGGGEQAVTVYPLGAWGMSPGTRGWTHKLDLTRFSGNKLRSSSSKGTVSVTVPDEIGNGTEREDVALDRQINLEVDNDDVHRLLDTHNQELAIDELIEIHE
ncbi:hypothetical protein TNCV_3407481 [Trichonephila clavipes]|nr:hypothetical protein TNCV_3407481 [Trichonephila clavipes]